MGKWLTLIKQRYEDYKAYRDDSSVRKAIAIRNGSVAIGIYSVLAFLFMTITHCHKPEVDVIQFGYLFVLCFSMAVVVQYGIKSKKMLADTKKQIRLMRAVMFGGMCGLLGWNAVSLWAHHATNVQEHYFIFFVSLLTFCAFCNAFPIVFALFMVLQIVSTLITVRMLKGVWPEFDAVFNIIVLPCVTLIYYNVSYSANIRAFHVSEELKAVHKEKEHFMVNMTHEMRSPLNAILGKNQIISNDSEETWIHKLTDEISDSGKMLMNIINNILDIAKAESGKMNVMSEEYHSFHVTYEPMEMMKTEAERKGLAFKYEFPENMPKILVGDDNKIREVIVNLLSNAIKYTKQGSVTFKVEYIKPEGESNKGRFIFSVQDTGIGIKEEDLEKLGKVFSRVDEVKNRYTQGTGLGLAISNMFLNLMNTELKVRSTYGYGSTFSFEIEQEIADATPLKGDERPEKETEKVPFKTVDLEVLVVDDSHINFTVMESFLKYYDVETDYASNGKQCIEKLSKKPYDMVFIDHMMPEMDGVDTLAKIREKLTDAYRDVPIIALTGNDSSDALETYQGYGFTDFMAKPVLVDKLYDIMNKYVPKNKRR